MRQLNLIDLLLKNNSKPTADESKADRLLRLNRHAALLYGQASREAEHYSPATRSTLSHLQTAAMAARATAELARVNLTNTQQFNAAISAIEAWQPASSDPAFRQCQIVRKALIAALPKVQQKQELQAICHDYKAHLKEDIVSELKDKHPQEYAQFTANRKIKGIPLPDSGKLPTQFTQAGKNMDRFIADHPQGVPNGSDSLNAAIKKYAAVNTMTSTLTTPQPVETQLQNFKQAFQSQRAVIEKDRDSWGMKFVKTVTTVLSLGVAVLCGIWGVKGKQAADNLTRALTSSPPVPVPGFT